MEMKPSVMIWRDTGYIIVPFDTEAERAAWLKSGPGPEARGLTAPYGYKDDPRWQCVLLADPAAAPTVLSPEDGAKWAMYN